jgi:hypothetical protein
MDMQDFNRWVDDFAIRQPAVDSWVEKLDNPKATRRTWFDVAFSGFDLDEAMEVTQQIQAGTVELTSWQDVPKIYRRAVCDLRLAALDQGRSVPEPCDFGDYRYKCRHCRDTGLVTCWSVDAMHRARRRLLDDAVKQAWTICAVACSCDSGTSHASWPRRAGKEIRHEEMPRYDPERWLRLELKRDEDDRQTLLDWAEEYRPKPRHDFGEYTQTQEAF